WQRMWCSRYSRSWFPLRVGSGLFVAQEHGGRQEAGLIRLICNGNFAPLKARHPVRHLLADAPQLEGGGVCPLDLFVKRKKTLGGAGGEQQGPLHPVLPEGLDGL